MLRCVGALFRLSRQVEFIFAANPTFFAEFDLDHDLIARFLYTLVQVGMD
ncbi:MAG: hypothetical protein II856_05855 [Bacteroidales bacterium]|nr:hypothetical protein [Bacteroidales bacterium]